MADVFVSYSRSNRARVAAREAIGWSVWWDVQFAAVQRFGDQIDAALQAASAESAVSTPPAVGSRWVRGEACDAAERGILVPVRCKQARLPIDARAIQTTGLDPWGEDPGSPNSRSWRALSRPSSVASAEKSRRAPPPHSRPECAAFGMGVIPEDSTLDGED